MKSHILFLHKHFHQGGGIERVHLNLARALGDGGVKCVFYIMRKSSAADCGVEVLRRQFEVISCTADSNFRNWVKDIKQLIAEHMITDIIAATEQANLLAIVCKSLLPDVSIICTRHSAFDFDGQKLPAFMLKLLYALYSRYGQVVAVSKQLKREIAIAPFVKSRNVHWIPNAVVDAKLIEQSTENSELKPSSPYMIAVGRLAQEKGYDLLLAAYKKANQMVNDLPELLILGEGKEKEKLIKQIKSLTLENRVTLLGFIANPYPLIRGAEYLVLSSRYEGMPTVMIEALALNVPVISFDCPTGPSEIIDNGKNGLLIEHLNVDALAKAISDCRSLAKNDLYSSVEQFSFGEVKKRYLTLFGNS